MESEIRGGEVPKIAVTGRTRIFGILADPVWQVKTPQVMHAVFARRGIDAVLVPFHVSPNDLPRLVDGLRVMRNFGGFIATLPHKGAMLGLCDRASTEAQAVGAVNCVRREEDGSMTGAMLDGIGFVEGLRRAGHDPAGRRAYLAGAGGAASAIAFALAGAGVAQLTIGNRTAAKAEALAARLRESFPNLGLSHDAEAVKAADLVVNATALGMRPGDALPLDGVQLHARQIVAEAIMDPAETPLLAQARAVGATVHPGLPMLECQIELMARHMDALA